jgi:hypothetical protein
MPDLLVRMGEQLLGLHRVATKADLVAPMAPEAVATVFTDLAKLQEVRLAATPLRVLFGLTWGSVFYLSATWFMLAHMFGGITCLHFTPAVMAWTCA